MKSIWQRMTAIEYLKVVTYSDVYGLEIFSYETIEQARKGFEQLKEAFAKAVDEDQIERTILLVIDGVTIKPEER